MKLTFLGTCSGTEPMLDRHHTSFVIEEAGHVYWFDAGEDCSYTAHLLGIAFSATRAIFVSHPHGDHTLGLPNLLGNLLKLSGRSVDVTRTLSGRRVEILTPLLSQSHWLRGPLAGFAQAVRQIGGDCEIRDYRDGIIYDDHVLRVIAVHNRHIGEPPAGEEWQSYSFRIETSDSAIVYSGDVKHVSELEPILAPCDLLLMETGHHLVEDVCHYLRESGKRFDHLGFIHHGRAILADPEREARKARDILGERVFVADDGMSLSLGEGAFALEGGSAESLTSLGAEPLIAMLDDPDWRMRQTAAKALSRVRDGRPVEPLVRALQDRYWPVREAAARTLGRIGDRRAVQPLVAALADPNEGVCRVAAYALGCLGSAQAIGDAQAVEALIAMLQRDPTLYRPVGEAAAAALGDIGDERAVEPLTAALSHPDSCVRGAATAALRAISGRNESQDASRSSSGVDEK